MNRIKIFLIETIIDSHAFMSSLFCNDDNTLAQFVAMALLGY